MSAEPTKEEKARQSSLTCMACHSRIPVGPNYPLGVPLPRTLELWCTKCKVINLFQNPLLFKEEVVDG